MNPVRDVLGEYMKSGNYIQSKKLNGPHNKQMHLISASYL